MLPIRVRALAMNHVRLIVADEDGRLWERMVGDEAGAWHPVPLPEAPLTPMGGTGKRKRSRRARR